MVGFLLKDVSKSLLFYKENIDFNKISNIIITQDLILSLVRKRLINNGCVNLSLARMRLKNNECVNLVCYIGHTTDVVS